MRESAKAKGKVDYSLNPTLPLIMFIAFVFRYHLTMQIYAKTGYLANAFMCPMA